MRIPSLLPRRPVDLLVLVLVLGVCPAGCSKGAVFTDPAQVLPGPTDPAPGHGTTAVDTAPKEDPRLLGAEVLVRSYVSIFGALSPLAAQRVLQASGGALFDAWTDYLGALGFPDYRVDLPRSPQTNALMVATFERVAIALCDAALIKDRAAAAGKKAVYDFAFPADTAPSTLTQAQFGPGFDSLHRLFLGYPARLAPTDRAYRFYQLYQLTVNGHAKTGSAFKPNEAGWAAVCYGLARHPEFHFY